MGKGREDVQHEAEHFPFRVSGEAGGVVRIGLGDREFTPPEISAFILRELKHRAEAFFAEQGEFDNEVDRAVITVPAYFNDAQRTATRDAGPHRRPRGAADHQRADRGVARLRPRQAAHRHHRRLRPGRRHVRHLDPEGRGRRLPGALDQRRHPPRRRRHRRPADGHRAGGDVRGIVIAVVRRPLDRGRRRSRRGGSGDPQGRHPGEVGSVRARGNRHRRRRACRDGRGGALQAAHHARRVRADHPADRRPHAAAVPPGARRRGPRADAGRRSRAGRRLDADSAGAPLGGRPVRPDAAQRAEP